MRATSSAFLALLFLCAGAVHAQSTPQSTYANVWHWLPSNTPSVGANLQFRWLPDGDVLVTFHNLQTGPAKDHRTFAFFSQRLFTSTEEAFHGALPPPSGTRRAQLPSGKIVRLTVPNHSSDCARGLGSKVTIEDDRGNTIRTTSLVLVLDEPTRNPRMVCEGGEVIDEEFSSSVAILRPFSLLPLSDNSFLVADLKIGAVVRLDENLTTRSPLLGRRLFLFEPAELDKLARGYPKPVGYGIDWRRFFADLHAKLAPRPGG